MTQIVRDELDFLAKKEISVLKSFSGNIPSQLSLGNFVSEGSAQIVYKLILEGKNHVLKVLTSSVQKDFQIFQGCQFDEIDFYGSCLVALRDCGVSLPCDFDVLLFNYQTRTNILAFVQTHIAQNFVDDKKVGVLPDLSLLRGDKCTSPRGNHYEWFYLLDTQELIFGDWDKYLYQLARIAHQKKISTRSDLDDFITSIKRAFPQT